MAEILREVMEPDDHPVGVAASPFVTAGPEGPTVAF
jgi:hypothetical protein